MIKYYQDTLGCKDDQNINSCGKVPYSGKMIRPVNSGRITSNFGYRLHPTKNVWKLHSGTDIAGGSTDIYAVAPGTVAGIMWKTSCGGTMLFVHHNINPSKNQSTGRVFTLPVVEKHQSRSFSAFKIAPVLASISYSYSMRLAVNSTS